MAASLQKWSVTLSMSASVNLMGPGGRASGIPPGAVMHRRRPKNQRRSQKANAPPARKCVTANAARSVTAAMVVATSIAYVAMNRQGDAL